ncbi:penicillin-binding protein [Salibacterium salarium]|uniref:transglycosylase domain-containing protein n=1 Tax=Salibacterium salarium TaxID=284579 RepID=UPI002789478D|nr:transglycosylase domain-containing protein [Salibacterium salarium]MDQ0298548.1 penicillin-binding protein [Salibacterium salarium]
MRNFFEKLNNNIDNMKDKPVIKSLNITSQVFWNLLLILFVSLIMLTLFAGGTGAGYFLSLIDDQKAYSQEEFQNTIFDYEETSGIYFSEGEFLGEIPAELERKERSLDEMSDNLVNAVISTEDEYFFEHDGIVPKALLRATYQEVTNAETQTGGSTLTQQVVKNQILTNEVSFDRKAKEIALAMRMEQYFDKEEILEAYLNIVPFGRNSDGQNIAGAQSASEGIFGVDASELNPAQAAFIAGLPKNPYTYTPFAQGGEVKESFEAGLNRMELVLANMRENDFITEEEYQKALEYNIKENLTGPTESSLDDYPYLTNETQRRAKEIILDDLLEDANINLEDLDEEERQEYDMQAGNELAVGGYNVHITIQKDIYDAMQNAVASSQWFGPDKVEKDGEGTVQEEVGAMMIDNNSGAILSFVGGRDFNVQNLNHATQTRRQNGSTMKPLLAYGPAMEEGLVQPGTVLPDVPGEFSNGEGYTNYGDGYEGFVSVREGLKESRNSPAVRTFEKIVNLDHDIARNALLDLGFTNVAPAEPYPSAAIGAFGTTVEQNTNAFSTFGNNGEYNDSYMIEKIETKDGEVIFEQSPESNEVFSPQTTFLMVDMLRDVLDPGGTAGALPGMMNFGGDWAGKTGTTNDTRDSWFVGFNPNVTFGTWIGYDDPQTIENYHGLSYGARTQQIWSDMMNAAYEADEETLGLEDQFEQPNGIVRQTICGISGKLPSSRCQEAGLTTTDYFNEKYLPSQSDDSLESEPFVTINGNRYLAYDSTPSEFTQTGISIDEDLFDVEEVGEYLPDDWDNVTPDTEAPNNGRTPSPVANVSYSNGELTWSAHSDNDIVGYRVYSDNGSSIGSVQGDSTSFSIGSGSYFVTAVDSVGRESSQSATTERSNQNDNDDEEENEEDSDSSDDNTDNNEDNNSEDDNSSNDDNNNNNSEDNSENSTENEQNDNSEDQNDSGNDNSNDDDDNENEDSAD